MSDLTVEEAWEALDLCPCDDLRHTEQRATVRAGFLAVLEEAVHSANCVLRSIGEDPIMDGHDLRTRIEALGR